MTFTTPVDSSPLLLNVRNTTVRVTPEQFDQLCHDNPDLRLELTKVGLEPFDKFCQSRQAFFNGG